MNLYHDLCREEKKENKTTFKRIQQAKKTHIHLSDVLIKGLHKYMQTVMNLKNGPNSKFHFQINVNARDKNIPV